MKIYPDNKALIEEARRYVTIHNRTHIVSSDLVGWLADALEAAGAEKERLRKVNHQDHQDNLAMVENVVAQLQQTQTRLEEAVRFLDALNSSRWPPGTSPVNDFLALLQDNKESNA